MNRRSCSREPRGAEVTERGPAALFAHLTKAYERGPFNLAPTDWPRLTALLDRLEREGSPAATEAEAAWLCDLEERASYALAIAELAGPGHDKASARARLTDAFREGRR